MTAMTNGLSTPHGGEVVSGAVSPTAQPSRPPRVVVHLSRVQILDATLSCLLESGYDSATIRQIAKRLGCAVGSIYRYFKDKRDLLGAVTQRQFEPIVHQTQAGAPLDKTLQQYARIAIAEPELYRLMFWINSVGHSDRPASAPPVIEQILEGWTKQLTSPDQAQQCWSQVHGCIMLGQSLEQIFKHIQTPASQPSSDSTDFSTTIDSLRQRQTPCAPAPSLSAPPAAPTIEASDLSRPIMAREDVTLL